MSGCDIFFSFLKFDASNLDKTKHIAIIIASVKSIMYPKSITYSEEDIF